MTEELNKAAEEYTKETAFDNIDDTIYSAFKAGAKWCAEYISKCIGFMSINNPKV